MKKFVAVVVSLVLLLCLSGCGGSYTYDDIKEARKNSYSEGYEAGRRAGSGSGSGGSYDEGYDAGWEAAMRDVARRELDEGADPTEFSGRVERDLEPVVYYFCYGDTEYYTEEEVLDLLESVYGYAVQYNETH